MGDSITPREMIVEGLLMDAHPGNCYKRVGRLDKLSSAIGAMIYYGLNCSDVYIKHDANTYATSGMRQAENCLRRLKRRVAQPEAEG